jgi:hypothetical protein
LVLSKNNQWYRFVAVKKYFLEKIKYSINMKNLFLPSTAFLLISSFLILSSCSGSDGVTPSTKSRNVKYELTGSYTGKITVAYTLANGGTQGFPDITLPWTKEIVYESSVLAIAFSGNGDISLDNVPGQTVNINIYSDNKVVKSGSASVSSDKILILPTFSYLFP